MKILGTLHKRFVYAYEFPDNHVYVGLTYNISRRQKAHEEEGTVFNYCCESKLEPIFKQLILEPVDVEKAKKLENEYLERYKNEGWRPLNKIKTGGIGRDSFKWNFSKLKEEALKYNSRSEFENCNSSAYNSARIRGFLEDICKHMIFYTNLKVIGILIMLVKRLLNIVVGQNSKKEVVQHIAQL